MAILLDVETVLVTGGTGFLAGHCIVKLLNEGYKVRTTIRDISKQYEIKEGILLLSLLNEPSSIHENLVFFKADLLYDDGWAEALSGCHFVLHMAGPVPYLGQKDEDALLIPTRDGTLRVLRHSVQADIKKFIYTSSYANMMSSKSKVYDEQDWATVNYVTNFYLRAKLLTEKVAWDFINNEHTNPNGMKFTSINPAPMFGPKLPNMSKISFMTRTMKDMLQGSMKHGSPKLFRGVVDVRDVATIHTRALALDSTSGERYLVTATEVELSILELATILKKQISSEEGKNLPTREIPTTLLRMAQYLILEVKYILSAIAPRKEFNSSKAKSEFNWEPIRLEKSLHDTMVTLYD